MGTFLGTLKRVSEELHNTKNLAKYTSTKENPLSSMGGITGFIKKYQPFGGDTILNAHAKLKYGLNRADTALGAIARGNAQEGSLRHTLFSSIKDSMIPQKYDAKTGLLRDITSGEGKVTTNLFRRVPRASISAPLAAAAGIYGVNKATSSAVDQVNKLRGKQTPPPEPLPDVSPFANPAGYHQSVSHNPQSSSSL